MSENPEIWIVAEEEVEIEDVQGARRSDDIGGGFGPQDGIERLRSIVRKRKPVDALLLKSQMSGLLKVVKDLFDEAGEQTGMQLTEAELTVEITAEGQVSLVGNGGKLGNKGGITLKFTRSTD